MNSILNSIYSSSTNNISSFIARTKVNSKDISSTLFATQLENAKKTDTYLNEIKNCYFNTTVTIKSMTTTDIQKYYEDWKKQSVDYSGFKHDIIVSPKVLERMEKDPKYAQQMLVKIKEAAIPKGFGNATIYEYKIIVRDDGEIHTLACADFMNGKNKKTDNDDEKKAEKKKREKKAINLIYENKRLYNQWELQTLLGAEIRSSQPIETQYLFNTGVANSYRLK